MSDMIAAEPSAMRFVANNHDDVADVVEQAAATRPDIDAALASLGPIAHQTRAAMAGVLDQRDAALTDHAQAHRTAADLLRRHSDAFTDTDDNNGAQIHAVADGHADDDMVEVYPAPGCYLEEPRIPHLPHKGWLPGEMNGFHTDNGGARIRTVADQKGNTGGTQQAPTCEWPNGKRFVTPDDLPGLVQTPGGREGGIYWPPDACYAPGAPLNPQPPQLMPNPHQDAVPAPLPPHVVPHEPPDPGNPGYRPAPPSEPT